MRAIQVESGDVKIKVGETELVLSLAECSYLLNKLKSVFPHEALIGAEIAAGKREFRGPTTGVALPGGWSLPAAIDPNAVFANAQPMIPNIIESQPVPSGGDVVAGSCPQKH